MGIRSGKTEPTWIASAGALVYEDVDLGEEAAVPVAPPLDPTVPPRSVIVRYRPPSQGGLLLEAL